MILSCPWNKWGRCDALQIIGSIREARSLYFRENNDAGHGPNIL